MQSMRIEYVPIDELRPAERNARTHPPRQLSQLAAAIMEFNFISPIVVGDENKIVGGHARWQAAKMAGLPTVPVIRLDHLSEPQKRALALALNKISLNAAWDGDILRAELKDLSLEALPFDLEITGFDTAEIDLLIDGASSEVHPWDDAPALEPQAVSRTGDHWLLGDHHLLCGDALKERSYADVMGGEKARTVFADCPYNVPIKGHVGGLGAIQHREFAMASGEMSEAEFTQFLNTAFARMASVSVDGAIHFICMDWRHVGEVLAAGKPVYSDLKNICVWNKDNGGLGSFYRSKHELVFVFKVGSAAHVNTIELGRSGRYRTNVWDYAGVNTMRPGRREDLQSHPTVKPTALVMDAIKDCSQRGDLVLDPFCGSGTTIIAAQKCARRARAMEIDPLYVDVAIRRWQKLTGGTAVLDVTGETFDEVAALRLAEAPAVTDAAP
jgi:DNA modification methylase